MITFYGFNSTQVIKVRCPIGKNGFDVNGRLRFRSEKKLPAYLSHLIDEEREILLRYNWRVRASNGQFVGVLVRENWKDLSIFVEVAD